jgi:hypothetical protein
MQGLTDHELQQLFSSLLYLNRSSILHTVQRKVVENGSGIAPVMMSGWPQPVKDEECRHVGGAYGPTWNWVRLIGWDHQYSLSYTP